VQEIANLEGARDAVNLENLKGNCEEE